MTLTLKLTSFSFSCTKDLKLNDTMSQSFIVRQLQIYFTCIKYIRGNNFHMKFTYTCIYRYTSQKISKYPEDKTRMSKYRSVYFFYGCQVLKITSKIHGR